MNRIVSLTTAVCLLGAGSVRGGEEGVALTVYNGGYGVVREIRNVAIGADHAVMFADVATGIDATTVHFKSLTDPRAKLLEQNYQYDLVSADKLLQKYIDQPIEVVCTGKTYSGTLLSFDAHQLVLQEANGITMVQRPDNVRDIRFGILPDGLLTRPTLVWLVATDQIGQHLTEVSYQTSGLNWHAEYVLVLAEGDARADLSGWVSVENRSGKSYHDARLKFIAGDVRRVPKVRRRVHRDAMMAEERAYAAAPMQEKAFFEYHLYTLPRPSTVANNEVKQLEMFTPVQGMSVQKKFLYSPLGQFHWGAGGRHTDGNYGIASNKKVKIFIEFTNSEENMLGMPLPAGKVRVYKQDPDDNALEFVGEERIDHTPKDEELSLQIGNAFDIVGERKQLEFQVEKQRHWMRETIQTTIRNHKKQSVIVLIKEPMYRWSNWRITDRSHEHEKLDARTVAFDVEVPAEGKTVLTYTVNYSW